ERDARCSPPQGAIILIFNRFLTVEWAGREHGAEAFLPPRGWPAARVVNKTLTAWACLDPGNHAIALRRAVRRETLRDAVLLCSTRFWADRISTGCASASAALAASLSPAAIASSTLRT